MSYETVSVDIKEHIGIVTLNRPEKYNTFSSQLAEELNDSLLNLDNNEKIRVIVIKGAGKSFCAGIDVSEFEGKSQREYKEWIELMEKPFQTIATMKKPVIASVHGHAVANGIGLVAACDLAVVSEDAKLGATAIDVGLFCMGPAVLMYRTLGRKRTLEMVLTGEMITGEKAADWGLANRVVPEENLNEETMKIAENLASKSPIALQTGKRAFYNQEDMMFDNALEYSNEAFAGLCTTKDATEGVKAFLENREPDWKGE
ncbi:enoyl-CoA hydratase [candidate division MSBL1 archaeon SCGC-AAA382N08]|uniref:Enoyl-CoA hydratase domain-containing protein 3, mitochondrial n=1 Tax=candidate division MSBL1 archaeon SCGC-AAA382N08 TaxID=1698285 RepID=A0A133VQV3_9EURY|nr:enoyl-CoA hydratase [candidate division MSBL1 archaeon SCGC-AAA382N08]